MLRRPLLLVPLVSFLAGGVSYGFPTFLTADPDNAHENPPTTPTLVGGASRPLAFGHFDFVLNDAQTSMTMSGTVTNLDFTGTQTADPNDNVQNAHIHASATVTATTNVPSSGFIGSPQNDVNPADVVVTPFPAPGVCDDHRQVGSARGQRHDAHGAAQQHPDAALVHQLPHDAVCRRGDLRVPRGRARAVVRVLLGLGTSLIAARCRRHA